MQRPLAGERCRPHRGRGRRGRRAVRRRIPAAAAPHTRRSDCGRRENHSLLVGVRLVGSGASPTGGSLAAGRCVGDPDQAGGGVAPSAAAVRPSGFRGRRRSRRAVPSGRRGDRDPDCKRFSRRILVFPGAASPRSDRAPGAPSGGETRAGSGAAVRGRPSSNGGVVSDRGSRRRRAPSVPRRGTRGPDVRRRRAEPAHYRRGALGGQAPPWSRFKRRCGRADRRVAVLQGPAYRPGRALTRQSKARCRRGRSSDRRRSRARISDELLPHRSDRWATASCCSANDLCDRHLVGGESDRRRRKGEWSRHGRGEVRRAARDVR
jgi:hypothetical protein